MSSGLRYENALVNAELYYALSLWADAEEVLGDGARAAEYRQQRRQAEGEL